MYEFENKMKFQLAHIKLPLVIFGLFTLTLLFHTETRAQGNKQMVRLAKIKVDPLQLEKYNAALKEQMSTAIRVETGVNHLLQYAVKHKPCYR